MSHADRTILIAGASRGLGLGLAEAYLGEGAQVIATARDPAAPGLAALTAQHGDRLQVERLDVTVPKEGLALAERLAGRKVDLLFVVAGMFGARDTPVQDLATDAAALEFITNALSPVALAERLEPVLAPGATVAFMTSVLGSIASNAGGTMDLYRATKAALNMFGSCYAMRHRDRPVVLMHPGWVKTAMGGPEAPVDISTSVAGMIKVLAASRPGLTYRDYAGESLPW